MADDSIINTTETKREKKKEAQRRNTQQEAETQRISKQHTCQSEDYRRQQAAPLELDHDSRLFLSQIHINTLRLVFRERNYRHSVLFIYFLRRTGFAIVQNHPLNACNFSAANSKDVTLKMKPAQGYYVVAM